MISIISFRMRFSSMTRSLGGGDVMTVLSIMSSVKNLCPLLSFDSKPVCGCSVVGVWVVVVVVVVVGGISVVGVVITLFPKKFIALFKITGCSGSSRSSKLSG